VNDVAIRLEHVDLFDGLDWLHIHLLERGLELLVVGAGVLVDLLDLSSGGTLSSVRYQLSAIVLFIRIASALIHQ